VHWALKYPLWLKVAWTMAMAASWLNFGFPFYYLQPIGICDFV